MQVEHAALGACAGRGVQVEQGAGDAVDVQDAGEREAAEPGTDDGDGVVGVSWGVGVVMAFMVASLVRSCPFTVTNMFVTNKFV
ncbi:hypothetical protein ACIREE_22680 [Streptomyces sp. NPDC102467]|uniref:hypothetical protein n=1 Tax=Streptomyces sp. NPDC102467 TaxID=3366179 RepID=UPI00382A4CEF